MYKITVVFPKSNKHNVGEDPVSNTKESAVDPFFGRCALMNSFKNMYFVKSLFVDATSTQERKIRLTEKCVVTGVYGRLQRR